jgi:acyl-CoA reductase-like NAD-dependent aldehyde dehydrogenase
MRQALQQCLQALTDSLDAMQSRYDEDWRNRSPMRARQLQGMADQLAAHKAAIAAAQAALDAPCEPVACATDEAISDLRRVGYAIVGCPRYQGVYGTLLFAAPPDMAALQAERDKLRAEIAGLVSDYRHGVLQSIDGTGYINRLLRLEQKARE